MADTICISLPFQHCVHLFGSIDLNILSFHFYSLSLFCDIKTLIKSDADAGHMISWLLADTVGRMLEQPTPLLAAAVHVSLAVHTSSTLYQPITS